MGQGYDRAVADRRTTLLTWFVAIAVAVAFADSSIVVLALPELYGRFDTTIEGVSWVVTAYNASVALVALTPRRMPTVPVELADHELPSQWIMDPWLP